MFPLIRRLFNRLLYDEAAAQRAIGATLFYAAGILAHGGNLPGTSVTLPLGDFLPYAPAIGEILKALAVAAMAGSFAVSKDGPQPTG